MDLGADTLLAQPTTTPAVPVPETLRGLTRVVDVGRCKGARGSLQDGALCWAHVENATAAAAATLCTAFLVLLKCPEGWRIISRVHSSRPVAAAVAAGIGWDADRANMAGARACVEAYYAVGERGGGVANRGS